MYILYWFNNCKTSLFVFAPLESRNSRQIDDLNNSSSRHYLLCGVHKDLFVSP